MLLEQSIADELVHSFFACFYFSNRLDCLVVWLKRLWRRKILRGNKIFTFLCFTRWECSCHATVHLRTSYIFAKSLSFFSVMRAIIQSSSRNYKRMGPKISLNNGGSGRTYGSSVEKKTTKKFSAQHNSQYQFICLFECHQINQNNDCIANDLITVECVNFMNEASNIWNE